MNYKRIIYKRGRVTQIIMNRPEVGNALSGPMFNELEDAFDRAATDVECRVIVLSGAGRSFCVGHDAIGLTSESAPIMRENIPPEELIKQYPSEKLLWKKYNEEHHYFISSMRLNKWRKIAKPTIAMVQGYAIFGGFFSAASMDIIFASEDALFLPAIGNYDVGGWDFNPRRWLEALYEHRFLTAQECYDSGFVNRVFPDRETLEKETLAYANRVADNDRLTQIRFTKLLMNHTKDLQGFNTALEDAEMFTQLQLMFEPPEEAHLFRYEGSGIARTPRALANLKAKLESEGKEVPQFIVNALERASKRNDKERWQKATQQSWREKKSRDSAEAEAKSRAEGKGK